MFQNGSKTEKKIMSKRELSRFSKETLLSHSSEKLRRGTHYCVIKFGYRKISD